MDILGGLLIGFQSLFHLDVFFYCFVGVFIGTLVGVLPGIGPVGAMSILLPSTFGISPTASIVMLAGIYYGAHVMVVQQHPSWSIFPEKQPLLLPVLTAIRWLRKGRAGVALGISAMGSFIGGTIAIFGLMFLVFPLAATAVKFGPAEFFSLMLPRHDPSRLLVGRIGTELYDYDFPRPDYRLCRHGSHRSNAAVSLRIYSRFSTVSDSYRW